MYYSGIYPEELKESKRNLRMPGVAFELLKSGVRKLPQASFGAIKILISYFYVKTVSAGIISILMIG